MLTANGLRIGDGGEFDALQLKLAQKLNRITEVQI